MAYVELTPLQKNSLPAKTTSLLADDGVSVEVDDQSVFYRGGVLLTKGWVLGPDNTVDSYTEEITVSATDATTGAGTVTISSRAIKADGTNGAAREWPIGTTIKNTYTTSTHDQVIDNFISHESKKATRTAAAMSVYVDSGATGTGNGTSWTDAFTTIQAAINSLPTILEHAVTIYVRKGASAYSGTQTVRQIAGKGSLTIRGEYYWVGQCAAAATPSTTKFNVTATDGGNIAIGDGVLVTRGIGTSPDYICTTVKGVVDKGSNVYEVELNGAMPVSSITTGDYYRIIKTQITSYFAVFNSNAVTITGFFINSASLIYGVYANNSNINLYYLITVSTSASTRGIYLDTAASVTCYGCHLCGSIGDVDTGNGTTLFTAASETGYHVCVYALGGIRARYKSTMLIRYAIFGTGTYGVYATDTSYVYLVTSYIPATITNGIVAIGNSVVIRYVLTNNATTPLTPASSTDNPVII